MKIEEINQKLDAHFEKGEVEEAEQLLRTSIEEAKAEGDLGCLLQLYNEMMGYLREISAVEESYQYAKLAKELAISMGLKDTVAYATTLLNMSNAYRAGGRLSDSLTCYREVIGIYEKLLAGDDVLFASMYNNMSLLYQEMEEYEMAKESLQKALVIVQGKNEERYTFEEAVTYANLANTKLKLNEDDSAMEDFQRAVQLFDKINVRDAHYAAALSSMGMYQYKKGEYAYAMETFANAMQIVEEKLGKNDFYARLQENYQVAREAYQRVQEIRQEPARDKELQDAGLKTSWGVSGLALCRSYYENFGKPMIHEKFAEYESRIAVGLCGEGSDCLGFDDALSRDHDWGPGFAMWVTPEVFDAIGEELQQAYEALPTEFMGYQRRNTVYGKNRVGVCTIVDFYERILGKEYCTNLTAEFSAENLQWENIPDEALAAVVSGEVFADEEGTFSKIRDVLQQGYPEKILYLKIAEACAKFSQNLQYNLPRVEKRGDVVTGQILLAEGLQEAMKLCYYMAGLYPVHTKWLYSGMQGLIRYTQETKFIAELMICTDEEKRGQMIEQLGMCLANHLYEQDYVKVREPYLEYHVTELMQKALFADLSCEELAARIAKEEYAAFDKVRNVGGRASCQNDWFTFSIMRKSQYLTWNRKMQLQYLWDFKEALSKGRNMITEKYGRMMESTAPEEYEKLKAHFPELSEEKKQIVEAIVSIQVSHMEVFAKQYPKLAMQARSIHTTEDNLHNTSYETYLRGEISTYSDKMLELYGRFVAGVAGSGKNLAAMTMENSAHLYGYATLEDAEKNL